MERNRSCDRASVPTCTHHTSAHLEATCQVPLAAHAVLVDGQVRLKAMVSSPDGKQAVQAEGEAPLTDSVALGRRIAADLLGNGAGVIIASL